MNVDGGLDSTRILREGQREQVSAGRGPDDRTQGALTEFGHLADGADPGVVQFGLGDRSDTPEPPDRQRVQEGKLRPGFDDQQPVGFADRARDLGEELRARAADRDR